MKNTINYLRTHRKPTHITQYDIATLLNLKDNSIVSRCEKGNRSPSLEMILLYQLLFDMPIHKLLPNHIDVVKERLIAGIPALVSQIEHQPASKHTEARIRFLNDALIRLTNNECHEK